MRIDKEQYGLIFKGFLVGGCAGIITIVYRQMLSWSEQVVEWVSALVQKQLIWLLPVILALLLIGFLLVKMLRFEPMISGSGIPQIEGEVQGRIHQNWRRVLPCKIIAGTLACLGGLSLGREGPSIQLGGMCGKGIAQILSEKKYAHTLIVCGAGAGLAAAFNAPLAGVLFCLEEVLKDFRPSILLSVIAAAVTGDFLSRIVFGFSPSFTFLLSSSLPLEAYGWVIGLGILCGVAGAFYNASTLRIQDWYGKISFLKDRKAVFVPLMMSAVFFIALPQVLCGGHGMIALLQQEQLLRTLVLLLLMKFLFSLFSFGSGAAGGIFFPMLVLGSYLGAIYGNLVFSVSSLDSIFLNNFIILGMAGLFSGIVRAPLTGVVLIMEMCGGAPQMLSLTFVSLLAYLVAQLLGSKPIYDSLLERMCK